MPAEFEYQLFEFDRVEAAFKAILLSQLSAPVPPVQIKRDPNSNTTPRVELVMTLAGHAPGGQKIIAPNLPSQFQPYSHYGFQLSASIVTNRMENAALHLPLCGQVTWALQMYRLAWTFTDAVSPLHGLKDMRQDTTQTTFENEGDIDITSLVFNGMFFIRENAWPR